MPLLEENGLDALVVVNPYNRRYLSGFEGSSGMLLVGQGKQYLLTDFRYMQQAALQASSFEVVRAGADSLECLAELVEKNRWARVGFEAKHTTFELYDKMNRELHAELVPLRETAEGLRAVKSGEELEILRRGAAELDAAFDYLCSLVEPGVTELSVALELEIFLRRRGAEGPAFRFIVASGQRGAMPHGTATSKTLDRGEMVTVDFGAFFSGYATDMTRTVALGQPERKLADIYRVVLEARQAALEVIKPGCCGKEVDGAARAVIEEAGYGPCFGHGLGHGVGLETHEQPVLNPRSDTVLIPGMVVTVEPGIYVTGLGGVRIEDMVLVSAEGAVSLTRANRELVIL